MNTNEIIQELESLDYHPWALILIGVPGTGKSTFVQALKEKIDFVVASTDDQIEAYAKTVNSTYSEVFDKLNFKKLQRNMEASISNAVSNNKNIVVDQTNMSTKSRKNKLDLIGSNYYRISLNFDLPLVILNQRLSNRALTTGKVIPDFVIKNMYSSYNAPSMAEGFDKIWTYV